MPSCSLSPLSSLSSLTATDTESDCGSSSGNPHEIKIILNKYLSTAFLPAFHRTGSPRSQTNSPARAASWPRYHELERPDGTRRLRETKALDIFRFADVARRYYGEIAPDGQISIPLHGGISLEKDLNLRLPSGDIVFYEDADINFLSNVDNEDDYSDLFRNYILRTISESIRIIEDWQPTAELTEKLTFKTAPDLAYARRARWDIFSLVGDNKHPDERPIIIIFIPPWEMGFEDFDEFASPRVFYHNSLDKFETKSTRISDTLWAVVNDACYHHGRYFIVTNYTHWAFGLFDRDFTQAHITRGMDAPILNLDNSSVAVPYLGFSIAEYMVFWAHQGLRRWGDIEGRLFK